MGDLRGNQQALRDQLKKLMEELRKRGFGQGQQGQGEMDQFGRAGEAMGEAEGELGEGNADGAVELQGRAIEALRRGAQNLAQSMQQQGMMGPGPNGQPGRLGQGRAQQETDPLGRPLRGRDYGDDTTVRVPGEIDVQRARRYPGRAAPPFRRVLPPATRARLHRAAAARLLDHSGATRCGSQVSRFQSPRAITFGVSRSVR